MADDNGPGPYELGSVPGGADSELDRLRRQATQWWSDESALLSRLGLRDGMDVLEVGSGPGFITAQLLAELPGSRITALDRDQEMLTVARRTLGADADRVEFVAAPVTDTALPDESFDLAYARLVFQHLPDPYAAARELHRLLRPGGRLVVFDVDDALHLRDPDYPPVVQAVERRLEDDQASRGGDRHVGRKLPRILRAAGFGQLTFATMMQHSDIVGMDTALPAESPESFDDLVASGLVSAEERDAVFAEDDTFRANEESIMILASVIVSGRRC